MVLELPRDLEAFADGYDQLSGPAVYALDIDRPDNLGEVWDELFDTRPAYFERLRDAGACVYVGASGNVLARLEDHRDGNVRKAVLPSIATDVSLRNVWFKKSKQQAFEHESRIGIRLRNHLENDVFVHWR
jgi:predicted GIY-YIG superfamily endonuclease